MRRTRRGSDRGRRPRAADGFVTFWMNAASRDGRPSHGSSAVAAACAHGLGRRRRRALSARSGMKSVRPAVAAASTASANCVACQAPRDAGEPRGLVTGHEHGAFGPLHAARCAARRRASSSSSGRRAAPAPAALRRPSGRRTGCSAGSARTAGYSAAPWIIATPSPMASRTFARRAANSSAGSASVNSGAWAAGRPPSDSISDNDEQQSEHRGHGRSRHVSIVAVYQPCDGREPGAAHVGRRGKPRVRVTSQRTEQRLGLMRG